jgi:hypothetical protein
MIPSPVKSLSNEGPDKGLKPLVVKACLSDFGMSLSEIILSQLFYLNYKARSQQVISTIVPKYLNLARIQGKHLFSKGLKPLVLIKLDYQQESPRPPLWLFVTTTGAAG